MKFAAIQLCSQENSSENLRQAERVVEAAARSGASALLLPEGFAYLGSDTGRVTVAERLGFAGPVQVALSSWCKRYGVSIIAGGFAEQGEDSARPFNSSVVFDRQGRLSSCYRKIHLFDARLSDGGLYCESRTTSPGSEVVVAEVEGLKVGLSICFDLRFPALFARQRELGAQVLTVPAAFTAETGTAHWRVLLRARAIENQCWVVAAAQGGGHPQGRRTHGHSMIADPWGKVLVESEATGSSFVIEEISLRSLAAIRERMPLREEEAP